MWLSVDGDRIAGFRSMLRWRFRDASGVRQAVRAVDTATHPDYQRLGIFRTLTTAAIEELATDGVDFVFNTPNNNSRPGYLRMGWREVGRIPTRFSIVGSGSLPRIARARTAADKWSTPCAVGQDVRHAEAELGDLIGLTPPLAAEGALSTDRTVEHLVWRYGFEPLHYRLVTTDDAAAIVRLRRRGAANEAVLAEMFSPNKSASRRLLRELRRTLDVDYILTLASPPHPAPWLPTLPRLGPRLTVRDLASSGPELSQFRFALGDIELF